MTGSLYFVISGGSGGIDEEGFINSYEDVPKVHVSQRFQ